LHCRVFPLNNDICIHTSNINKTVATVMVVTAASLQGDAHAACYWLGLTGVHCLMSLKCHFRWGSGAHVIMLSLAHRAHDHDQHVSTLLGQLSLWLG